MAEQHTGPGQGTAPQVGERTRCVLFKFLTHGKGRRRRSVPAGLIHALGEKETDRGLMGEELSPQWGDSSPRTSVMG